MMYTSWDWISMYKFLLQQRYYICIQIYNTKQGLYFIFGSHAWYIEELSKHEYSK